MTTWPTDCPRSPSQTAALQEQRFGFNSDWTAFYPITRGGRDSGRDGLLWVNHEYTDGKMMFPGNDSENPTAEQVDIELAAHGGSLVRVLQGNDDRWRFLRGERNYRVTATTPIEITGPAAGPRRCAPRRTAPDARCWER